MRKIILILPLVLLALLASQAYAWKWTTHRAVVKAAYDQLPENVRIHLSYTIIEDGSTWPDEYRDTPDPYGRTFPSSGHIQPGSRTQAAYWLTEAGKSYWENDFDNASLCLGIASHFIADSMCLVHNVSYNEYYHNLYESQGASLTPANPAAIAGFNLEQKLTEYHNEAGGKYQSWVSSQHSSIAQEGVDLSASYTYNAWCQALSVPLPASPEVSSSMDFRLIAVAALVILIVVIAIGAKRFYREEF